MTDSFFSLVTGKNISRGRGGELMRWNVGDDGDEDEDGDEDGE